MLLLLTLGEMKEVVKHWFLESRLAEKYEESQSTKEKIQKTIEVKKEHLISLQPGLNAIMQASYKKLQQKTAVTLFLLKF